MTQVVVLSPDELRSLVRGAVEDGVADALRDMSKNTPEVMTDSEAAEYLKFTPETLRRWRSQKQGPKYSKAGYNVRYARRDLDAWLESNSILTIDSLEVGHGKLGL